MTDLLDAIAAEVAGHDHGYEDARGTAQAIIDLIIASIPPLVFEVDQGTYYTDFGNLCPDYNFCVADRIWDEPIIVYLGTSEIATDCWDEEAAKAAANAHHVAQLCKGMGIE